jgi:hypothetical protein
MLLFVRRVVLAAVGFVIVLPARAPLRNQSPSPGA